MNCLLDKANSVHQPSVFPSYLPYNYNNNILDCSVFFMVKDSTSVCGDLLPIPCMYFVPNCANQPYRYCGVFNTSLSDVCYVLQSEQIQK